MASLGYHNAYMVSFEFATFYGNSPSAIEKFDEGFPIFGTGGVVGYTSEALCEGPSVILGRKGTIDRVQKCTGPFWAIDTRAIDTTYYTTPKREFDWSWQALPQWPKPPR